MKKCKACEDGFRWEDKVVVVNDEIYHDGCVTLYPTGFVAFIGDEFLGETENDDGSDASDYVNGLLDD